MSCCRTFQCQLCLTTSIRKYSGTYAIDDRLRSACPQLISRFTTDQRNFPTFTLGSGRSLSTFSNMATSARSLRVLQQSIYNPTCTPPILMTRRATRVSKRHHASQSPVRPYEPDPTARKPLVSPREPDPADLRSSPDSPSNMGQAGGVRAPKLRLAVGVIFCGTLAYSMVSTP